MPYDLGLAGALLVASSFQPGDHLSDWLLRQGDLSERYLPELSWQVPGEQVSQDVLKQNLLAQLLVGSNLRVSAAVRADFSRTIAAMPVTGRVPLAHTDPRWLQANPEHDPLLEPGQKVMLPLRPSSVSVWLGSGQRCYPAFSSGAQASDYLSSCFASLRDRIPLAGALAAAPSGALAPTATPSGASYRADPDLELGQADWVWLIQPDGLIRKIGVGPWNRETQDNPAPGARLWAPLRREGWPEQFSVALAQFWATQLPSAEELGLPQLPVEFTSTVPTRPARSLALSANDWGQIGLMQTPSARMAPEGEIRASVSHIYPYLRGNLFFQPLDWLEAGFRYTSIENRLYGTAIAGNQPYKDKSLDLKAQLEEEGPWQPQLALGLIDVGGTGLFSGEYLVASKRTGDFDWTLGLGWGYLAGSGNLKNPLTWLSPSYATRINNPGQGGNLNPSGMFHGPSALFGGVQIQSPWDNLLFKLEYDGNNYQNEPQSNNQPQRYPLNAGVVYRYAPQLELSAGWERGNTLMLGLTVQAELKTMSMPKFLDPPVPRVRSTVSNSTLSSDWAGTARDILRLTQWEVRSIRIDGPTLEVHIDQAHGLYFAERLQRALTVLHRDAPAQITHFEITVYEDGMLLTRWVTLRAEWVAQQTHYQAPSQLRQPTNVVHPWDNETDGPTTVWKKAPELLELGFSPNYVQTLGGPNNFILYEFGLALTAQLRLNDSTWVDSLTTYRLIDNFSLFTYDAPSNLPRVRTDIREYMTTARLNEENLQLNHVLRLDDNDFLLSYAGYLESMFAGLGGEWLHRPWDSRLAFGVDVNRVRQRGFAQDFSLLPYQVTTGHATLYWDTGWKQIHVNLSAGQYLAGDRGVTLDLNRRFVNGVTIGVFATKTNVSSTQYGEGSYDKGLYVQIPFDAFLPASSGRMGSFIWDPLIRDGGQKLDRSTTLYDLTSQRDHRAREYSSAGSSWWKAVQDQPSP